MLICPVLPHLNHWILARVVWSKRNYCSILGVIVIVIVIVIESHLPKSRVIGYSDNTLISKNIRTVTVGTLAFKCKIIHDAEKVF